MTAEALYEAIMRWRVSARDATPDWRDVLHQTYAVTLEAWQQGRIQGEILPYARAVLRVMCAMAIQDRVRNRIPREAFYRFRRVPWLGPSAEVQLLEAERQRLARRVVECLPAGQRNALLARLAGMRRDEAAERLGMTQTQYRLALNRGKEAAIQRFHDAMEGKRR